jgi:hypothetical protein
MPRVTTPFQERCSKALLASLKDLGVEANAWQLKDGEEESFYEGDLGPVKIWIYQDMADAQGQRNHKVYEKPDYKSEDDLIAAFVKGVSDMLADSRS